MVFCHPFRQSDRFFFVQRREADPSKLDNRILGPRRVNSFVPPVIVELMWCRTLGTNAPGMVPATSDLYGTEVFELNTVLMAKAYKLSAGLTLNDSATAFAFFLRRLCCYETLTSSRYRISYRSKFDYAPANLPPAVSPPPSSTAVMT